MTQWQSKKKTTPHKAMLHESQLPNSNASTVAETEEHLRKLFGEMLTAASCTMQFAQFVQQVVLSNSVTPKMEALLSFVLSEMVNHIMTMCAQARTLINILSPWPKIMPGEFNPQLALDEITSLIEEIRQDFDF